MYVHYNQNDEYIKQKHENNKIETKEVKEKRKFTK